MLRPSISVVPVMFRALTALALILLVFPASAPADSDIPETIELASGLRLRLDGAGGLELFVAVEPGRGAGGERPVGRIDLLLEGGLTSRPQSQGEHELSARGGAAPLELTGAFASRFAAQAPTGVQIIGTRADLAPLGLADLRLGTEAYHWPYFHVDDTLFWDAWLEGGNPVLGAPACRITSSNN